MDAPVLVRSGTELGEAELPSGPAEVVWYDFTSAPGEGRTAVYVGLPEFLGQPAVFGQLNTLENGDLIEVVTQNRRAFAYRVTRNYVVSANMPSGYLYSTRLRTESVRLFTYTGETSARGFALLVVIDAVIVQDRDE